MNKFLMWWCLVFRQKLPKLLHVAPDPLMGGGKSAQKQLSQLSATVSRLASAVQDLQNQRAGPQKPRRRKPKPKHPPPRPQPRDSAPASLPQTPESLWSRLQVLFAIAEASQVSPSDEEIRSTLQKMLETTATAPSGAGTTGCPGSVPKPRAAPKVQASPKPKPKPKGNPTFAQLVKGAAPLIPDRKQPKPQLVSQGWDAKCRIVAVKTLHALPDDPGSVVVVAHTDEELQEVLEWAAAASPTGPVACVDFFTQGPLQAGKAEGCDVLVRFPNSPAIVSKRAVLHLITDNGPKPISLEPKEEFQDLANSTPDKQPETLVLRLTLAKEYADPTRYGEAHKRPQTLPSLLLPSLASKVLRTFAVATYEGEITCLLSIRASDGPAFLKATLCPGTFIAPQRSATSSVQMDWSGPKARCRAILSCCPQSRPGYCRGQPGL